MTCRIDYDKKESICDIIYSFDDLGIKELHLYGSGTQEQNIENIIKKENLTNRVYMHGYVSNVYEVLKNDYTGVIGMGRSAAEAISMGLPTILVGYGKNCGLINKNNYEEIKNNNFAPIFLNSLNSKEIKKQIKNIEKNGYTSDVYKKLYDDCSSKNISKIYLKHIDNMMPNIRSNFIYLYNGIEKINSNECFATSKKIYNLSYKYLKSQSLNISLNTTMVYYNSLEKQITELNSKLDKINKNIDIKNKKINIKFKFKNSLKLLKRKIKK